MAASVITLLTDYGLSDEFVGVLHGVIASRAPDARVIDVSHGVPVGDVFSGALALARALPYLPVGVHVAVVDPGVGGERRAVAVQSKDGRVFVGPDNGLLWPALTAAGGVRSAVDIGSSPARLEPFSVTFHGRDLFAPVAAALAAGQGLGVIGSPLDPSSLVRLEAPAATVHDGALRAEVVAIDSFGNVMLGAGGDALAAVGIHLGADVQVCVGHDFHIGTFVRTFAEGQGGELLVYLDSSGHVACALYRDSAAARLGLAVRDVVELSGVA